ncbi:MAG: DUF134 domain-containing protein [Roseburia sp.]
MPRPQKCRKICFEPTYTEFLPDKCEEDEPVILTLDEYEVIRLVDLEKQTHEQCAKVMEISRSTVTEIYENAREKIADSIVNGRRFRISGGNYRFCDGTSSWCYRKDCKKWQERDMFDQIAEGDHSMRIAVTYENEEIFQHFGHTEQFKIYDIEDSEISSSRIVDTNGKGHGALARFLEENKVNTLICGGIGEGAQKALKEAGIALYGGVSGNADKAVSDLLAGNLVFHTDVKCSDHDHGHHGAGHAHGDHGCGKHS